MKQDNFDRQPEEEMRASENLSESELENVVGGMQNQLNNNPVMDHPGGANKSSINPGKTSFLCDAVQPKG